MNRSNRKSCLGLDLLKGSSNHGSVAAGIGELGKGRFLGKGLNRRRRGSRSWRWRRSFVESLELRSPHLFRVWTLLAEMNAHSFSDIVVDRAGVRFLVRDSGLQKVVEHTAAFHLKLAGQIINADFTLHRFQVSPSYSRRFECHRAPITLAQFSVPPSREFEEPVDGC